MNTINPYAKTYTTRPDDRTARAAKKEAMKQQLQQNPQFLQQLQSQEDIDILSELLGEMNMGSTRGGKRRRTNKRRRTFRRKRSTKRRR
jgi:hypothetical protein